MSRKIDDMSAEKVAEYVQNFCEQMATSLEENGKREIAQGFWIVYNEIQDGLLEDWDN